MCRNPERLEGAAAEVGAKRTAAFDASDPAALESFFRGLEAQFNHVLVTAGRPKYGPLADMTFEEIRDGLDDHLMQTLYVARATGDMFDREAPCCSWAGPAPAARVPASRSHRPRRWHRRLSSPAWRSSWLRYGEPDRRRLR